MFITLPVLQVWGLELHLIRGVAPSPGTFPLLSRWGPSRTGSREMSQVYVHRAYLSTLPWREVPTKEIRLVSNLCDIHMNDTYLEYLS